MAPAPKINISPSKGWTVQPAEKSAAAAKFSRVTGKPMPLMTKKKKMPQINKPKAVKKGATPKGKKPLTKADIIADSEGFQP